MRYWVIGAGKFGRQAVQRLLKRTDTDHITVVDGDGEALAGVPDTAVRKVCEDAVTFLTDVMDGKDRPDWIVPAVPVHLAFEWVLKQLDLGGGHWKAMPVPADVDSLVPNPMRGAHGQLTVSYADFLCPDHCTEPYDRCTFTGKPRKGILYQVLASLSIPGYRSIVIRSHQLAPGVGGYTPDDLREILKKVLNSHGPVLFSTACFCHGVMDGLKPATSDLEESRRESL